MALFDIMAQSGKQSLRRLFSIHFKEKNFKNNIPVYASAGSILGSLKDLKKKLVFQKKRDLTYLKQEFLFKFKLFHKNKNFKN